MLELCWRNEGPDGAGCVVVTVTLGLVAEAANSSTSASMAVGSNA